MYGEKGQGRGLKGLYLEESLNWHQCTRNSPKSASMEGAFKIFEEGAKNHRMARESGGQHQRTGGGIWGAGDGRAQQGDFRQSSEKETANWEEDIGESSFGKSPL